jgi:predicted acylesterase/phospholipase RssA
MAPLAAALQQQQMQQQQMQQQRAMSGRFASSRSGSSALGSSSSSSSSSVTARHRAAAMASSLSTLHCRRPPSVVRASSLSNGNGNSSTNGNRHHHHHNHHRLRRHAEQEGAFDLVLSSGFLAFALHTGFLKAVEEAGVPVAGIMGTSAGALAGSLFAAGYSAERVAQELSAVPPIQLLRPCWEPWRGGVLSMDAVVERLRDLLPPTFEDLERDFAVGVVDSEGNHVLIDRGPLPEAVVASAAIPFVFAAVDVPHQSSSSSSAPSTTTLSSVDAAEQAVAAAEHAERRRQAAAAARAFKDGGVVDRIGVKAWRERRRRLHSGGNGAPAPLPPCLVHVIERSSPFSGEDDAAATGEAALHVVRSPKSGVSFFDLGAFAEQFDGARGRALPVVQRAVERERQRVAAAMRVSSSQPRPVVASSSGGGGGGGVVLPLSATAAAAMSPGKRSGASGSAPPPVPQPQRVAPPTARPR